MNQKNLIYHPRPSESKKIIFEQTLTLNLGNNDYIIFPEK